MMQDRDDESTENVSTDGSKRGSKLIQDVGRLYLDETFADVTFLVGEEKLRGHKAMLAVRSQRFKDLFNENSEKQVITVPKTSSEAFRLLLRYIYTDTILIPEDVELKLQMLILAHQYSFRSLASIMITNIDSILDEENVCFFLDGANRDHLDDLRDICHTFIDANPLQILSSNSFSSLTEESVIQVLKRNTFVAPEIEIFKSIARWYKTNNNVDNLVLECVSLPLLTVSEIVSIVWPTKLVTSEKLLETLSEIVGPNSRKLHPRAVVSADENIATLQNGAEVISELDTVCLLTGNTNFNHIVKHTINGEHGIVIRVSRPHCINHIRMRLYDDDDRYCSYYIEMSLDKVTWTRVVDYSRYACRSVQNLYFNEQTFEYIKIVGTSNTKGLDFHLVFFEAFYKGNIPEIADAIICPGANVATPENNAVVVEGENPQILLNGQYSRNHCTEHVINADSSGIIVQLAQPYMVSSMQFLLYDGDNSSYKYSVETSVNKVDWEMVVDRKNEECKSWQDLRFDERAVVFIKITGTYSSVHKNFACVHFECPSEGEK